MRYEIKLAADTRGPIVYAFTRRQVEFIAALKAKKIIDETVKEVKNEANPS